MSAFTILIQGPVLSNLILMADQHKYANTIVSTWDYPALQDEVHLFIRNNLELVVNSIPDLTAVYNDQNRYLQFKSTYEGLQKVKSEYTIKVRSDEYYANLQPAVQKFLLDPNKILTNNVFFRKAKHMPYHPSDHLIIAKTELLKQVYEKCLHQCEKEGDNLEEGWFNQIPKRVVPEQQFAVNAIKLLEKKSYKLPTKVKDLEKIKSITKKHFEVVNTLELGNFLVSSKKYGQFENNMRFIMPEIDVISSMEQL